MCGFVSKRTNMRNVNHVLQAISAALGINSLGTITKQEDGTLVAPDGIKVDPKGKIRITSYGHNEDVHVHIPGAMINSQLKDGRVNSAGIALKNEGGTWTLVFYDMDENGLLNEAFKSKVFQRYNEHEVKDVVNKVGGKVVSSQRSVQNGQEVTVVRWKAQVEVEVEE
jgi:hypothetical protein